MRQDILLRHIVDQISKLTTDIELRADYGLESRRITTPDRRAAAIEAKLEKYDELLWHIDAGIKYLEKQEG